MEIPVSIRMTGDESGGRLGARVSDISAGGALLMLDGLPHWRFSEVLGERARLTVELDLGGQVRCALPARLERVSARENCCEVAVRFLRGERRARAALRDFLERYVAEDADADLRRRYRRHRRRRRNRRVVIVALAAVAGIALTVLCINLVEALPGWFSRGREIVRREVREVRGEVIDDQLRRMRESGQDPAEVYRSFTSEERERIRGLLTEEERRKLRLLLRKEGQPGR
jgi:hypothetical protein